MSVLGKRTRDIAFLNSSNDNKQSRKKKRRSYKRSDIKASDKY